MELLSIKFAIFVFQLGIAVIPFVIGVRLLTFSSEQKIKIKTKIAQKLLGDPQLLKLPVFNICLRILAGIFFLIGAFFALIFFLYNF